MIHDISFNAALLVSFMAIGGQLFRSHPIQPDAPLMRRLLFGFLAGLFGVILMVSGVPITPSVILDFRYIPIVLSALGGGLVSSVISGTFIGLFRLLYHGISSVSLVGFSSAIIAGLICGLLAPLGNSYHKMILAIIVIIVSGLSLILDNEILPGILSLYLLSNVIMGYFAFSYFKYVKTNNDDYRKLRDEATKDFLTGLNNVRSFDNRFNSMLTNAIKYGKTLSVLLIDIDFFKSVNDRFGHQEGDMVLKSVANMLISCSQEADIVARLGGEEFGILIDGPPSQAVAVAENIRESVQKHRFDTDSRKLVSMTVSIGVTAYPDISNDPATILSDADTALYTAKRAGRNKVVVMSDQIKSGQVDK